ncbi:50S ribosomal protein L20 [Candidatus Peregrinibacteria bacterium CG10_big_fil_rev_8_21_14_0_10_49_16]|nr:MAG: 50S ribosomal protein L20 [Candidatus Peregrinibacteria bacterium CG22_combo_CG10-13_8_21_14_all_49_11]PIR51739.1 MAG: 50S ribosomal protein L20 [Candidatus Peregrinibacteria bacterium CG10_big_fil_rev_8_21_14_0_10_49_16]
MRVKRGFVRRRRHKKIFQLAKGYLDMRHSTFKRANEALLKAGQHAYRDRRKKKRVFRSLWIARLNAAVRGRGVRYNIFMNALKNSKCSLDRKVLSELAVHHPNVFDAVLKEMGVKK